jgi:hypothetical protein
MEVFTNKQLTTDVLSPNGGAASRPAFFAAFALRGLGRVATKLMLQARHDTTVNNLPFSLK